MRARLPIFLLILTGAGFVFGLWQLFRLRFESGDVYPAYSSLRTDPLGTMAFYESLDRLPGVTVRRDFTDANRLPEPAGTTYLHLAAPSYDWNRLPEELFREIEGFVIRGGRLVITFYPEAVRPFGFGRSTATPAPPPGKPSSPPAKRKQVQTDESGQKWVGLKERWAIELRHEPLQAGGGESYRPVLVENVSDLPLPPRLTWHSGVVFTNLDPVWQVIYARSNAAVLVEKRLGAGSLVLSSDSYFLSNEALRQERHASLLAWLVSPARTIVFDEAHFGIVETSGVAGLLRKYRLYWLISGVLLLAGLFIWRNSTSLLPPRPHDHAAGFVSGKEAAAGFINLLRRSVAPQDLIRICFEKWTESLMHGSPLLIAKVDQAQALVETEVARPRRLQDPVRVYREICDVVKNTRS